MPNVHWVFGPSHVVRWKKYVEDRIVSQEIPPERFVGFGGAPIWSKFLFDFAKNNVEPESNIIVFVGDFRFGNSICMENNKFSPIFQENFINIDQSAINQHNDLIMLNRCLDAINIWKDYFGSRVKFVFWCLFGRQVHDRLAGKYINNKKYHHPTFNYVEVLNSVGTDMTIDLSPLLHLPMHDISRLFIDSSMHPSQMGVIMLQSIIFEEKNVLDSYIAACSYIDFKLDEMARRVVGAVNINFVITGRSIWLNTFIKYLGRSGIERLASLGMLITPLDQEIGENYLCQIIKILQRSGCKILVFSDSSLRFLSKLSSINEFSTSFWNNFIQIEWEREAAPLIIARGERPSYEQFSTDNYSPMKVIQLCLSDCMIEQGPTAAPTWEGIRFLLDRVSDLQSH